MDTPAASISSDHLLTTRPISSFDEYILTYFPKLQEQRAADAQSPQEFGASIAKQSLARIKDALLKNGAV